MEKAWFRRYGWFYLPVTVAGAVIVLIAVLFCYNVFLATDKESHSASDTLYGIYPFFISTFLLYDWIAGRTSEKKKYRPKTTGNE